MQQATPTPARGVGTTPSRASNGGAVAAAGGGGGGSGATGADSRPLELINACALPVTDFEKVLLENQSNFSGSAAAAVSSSGGAGHYPSPMTMATPTPVRGGGGGGGGGGGAFAPRGAGLASVSGGALGGEQGFLGRVEDGLTAFLVLALGVLRCASSLRRMKCSRYWTSFWVPFSDVHGWHCVGEKLVFHGKLACETFSLCFSMKHAHACFLVNLSSREKARAFAEPCHLNKKPRLLLWNAAAHDTYLTVSTCDDDLANIFAWCRVGRRVSPQPRDMNIEIHPGERGSIEAPVGAMIECK